MLTEAAICMFVFWLAWWFFKTEEPVDQVPGPPRLPVIGNTLQFIRLKPDKLLNVMTGYMKTYGHRFQFKIFNLRVMHVVDPADVEIILCHSKNITKSLPYHFLKDWLGNGLLLNTGDHWHKRRKVLTPAFHFNILKNFATIIEEKTKDLVDLLREKKGAEVDLMPVISDFTLFTICETAMGTKLDKDQSTATVEYKNAILDIGYGLVNRLLKVWLWNKFLFKMTQPGKTFFNNLEIAGSFADNVISGRRARRTADNKTNVDNDDEIGTKRRLAMLDLLLEAEQKGEIDLQGIRDEVNTFMFEGHDTTAMAITYSLMLLADHDDIQERIFKEIKHIIGDSERTPTMSEMSDMKYLEAVIKEVLRLYPSVPFIGREIVEDFMMGDVLVKKGTVTDIHIYDLHRREDLFPDAEAFKPERFLDGEIKHAYAYVPFSAGLRNCIGQRFAMQEMKCTLSEIIRNFKLVPKLKGARPRLMAAIALRPLDPIYVKFIPR